MTAEGTICTLPTLAAGASESCTATGTAQVGQYTNLGTASGTDSGGQPISASDPSNYSGTAAGIFDLELTKQLAAGQSPIGHGR